MYTHSNFLRHLVKNTAALAAVMAALAVPASALNIVLTNDDGFETNNIQALFLALKAGGHDVIMSTPYSNQSGTSGQVAFLTPIKATTKASAGGLLPIGSAGTGATTIAVDQYYVDGSPVAAALYGIDVLAKNKWGKAPDLVVSGPNVGNNLGVVTPHSGTVGAAIAAINKGIPAVAVSATNDDIGAAALVGQITLRVVNATISAGKVNLPASTGLNVNIPKLDTSKLAADYPCAYTQIGTSADFGLQFFQRMGDSPVAVGAGIPAGTPLPGVSIAMPNPVIDSNPTSESNVIAAKGTITVSPIQGTFQASADKAAAVLTQMSVLFPASTLVNNPRLTNTSCRANVGTGTGVQIIGFVIAGSAPKTVLIRAAGASLAPFGLSGLLADPLLEIYNDKQTQITSNDNWSDDDAKAAAIEAAVTRAGAWNWKRGTKDAAVLVTLNPGAYTAVVKGVSGSTGIALIEVFDPSTN